MENPNPNKPKQRNLQRLFDGKSAIVREGTKPRIWGVDALRRAPSDHSPVVAAGKRYASIRVVNASNNSRMSASGKQPVSLSKPH
jgi:hypothetical protein